MRLSIRNGGINGKEGGKIRLNLAEYANIPSPSKRVRVTLSAGAVLIVNIQSQYLTPGASLGGATGTGKDGKTETSPSESKSPVVVDITSPADFLRQRMKAKINSVLKL